MSGRNVFTVVVEPFDERPDGPFHVVVDPYSLSPPEYLRESRHVSGYLPCVLLRGTGRAELPATAAYTTPTPKMRGRLVHAAQARGDVRPPPLHVRAKIIPKYFAFGHMCPMPLVVSGRAGGGVNGDYRLYAPVVGGRAGHRVGAFDARGDYRLYAPVVGGRAFRSYRCAMTGRELIHWFRELSQDEVRPYLWEDDFVLRCLNEAENEAADRAKLLFDDATPEVVDIEVTAGRARYAHHPRIIDIEKAFFTPKRGGPPIPPHQMDRLDTDWRDRPHWRGRRDMPYGFVHDGDQSVTLAPVPNVDGTLHLEVHRLPLMPFTEDTEPEIPCIHHLALVDWALFRAFSIPDADEANERLAAFYHDRFERYFGRRVDARKRRTQRMNKPHVNKLW